jgi:hypothetical protein
MLQAEAKFMIVIYDCETFIVPATVLSFGQERWHSVKHLTSDLGFESSQPLLGTRIKE